MIYISISTSHLTHVQYSDGFIEISFILSTLYLYFCRHHLLFKKSQWRMSDYEARTPIIMVGILYTCIYNYNYNSTSSHHHPHVTPQPVIILLKVFTTIYYHPRTTCVVVMTSNNDVCKIVRRRVRGQVESLATSAFLFSTFQDTHSRSACVHE